MKEIKKIQSFTELLSSPEITEEVEIRSSFGVCALHGGGSVSYTHLTLPTKA